MESTSTTGSPRVPFTKSCAAVLPSVNHWACLGYTTLAFLLLRSQDFGPVTQKEELSPRDTRASYTTGKLFTGTVVADT